MEHLLDHNTQSLVTHLRKTLREYGASIVKPLTFAVYDDRQGDVILGVTEDCVTVEKAPAFDFGRVYEAAAK